jgi:hypothetical protein
MSNPPTNARKVSALVNNNANGEYKNAKAYSFDQINRDCSIFLTPEGNPIANFNGIQRESYCELKFSFKDASGAKQRLPGYVLARPVSGEGQFDVHDFLSRERPKEWGKMCTQCSKKHARPVYHKRLGEPVTDCISKLVKRAPHQSCLAKF